MGKIVQLSPLPLLYKFYFQLHGHKTGLLEGVTACLQPKPHQYD